MSSRRCVWDNASRGPLSEPARAALLAALDAGWADPTRLYAEGRQARLLLDAARESIAGVIGARADEIRFTPSGVASRTRALTGSRLAGGDARVVVSAVEHSAILRTAATYAPRMEQVDVDADGRVDPSVFAAQCAPGSIACLQIANQEVGTVQPVEEVHDLLDGRGVTLICDAAPALGHLPVPGVWSVLAASPDSFGGPSGIGILAVRTGTRWNSVDSQGDSPSVPLAAAAAIALEESERVRRHDAQRVRAAVDRLRLRLPELIPDCIAVGDPDRRLPHIATFTCMYVDGETLVRELDRRGFAVTSGSACVAEDESPSHVLAAMGQLTHGNVRLSLPWDVTDAEIERFIDTLPGVVSEARGQLL